MALIDRPADIPPQEGAPVTNEELTYNLPDKESAAAVEREAIELQPIVSFVEERFKRASDARDSDEQRWMDCYRNYIGKYSPEVQFTDTEKSQAFIKITKTKVVAAHNQIVDVLFAGGRFPLGVEPTPKPEGVAEAVHIDPKEITQDKAREQLQGQGGGAGAPKPPKTTVARQDILERVGGMKKSLERVEEHLREGPGLTPSALTWEPAKIAAKKMEKKIHDQLVESDAETHLRYLSFEMPLFGTGIAKGPFTTVKEYPRWSPDGKYTPLNKKVPDVTAVSIWNAYPDPDARNPNDMEYFIERHRMSRSQLRALKKRPGFRKESVENAVKAGANYVPESWETQLDAINEATNQGHVRDRFEVLEYWGIIDREMAEQAGITLPEELDDFDDVQVNIWICNGYCLRVTLNPFEPRRIPYYIVPYEINPYSVFGVGVAENMTDTQLLMNGFMRQAVDNAAISGNLIFEIDENLLSPGQDFKLYPGKIFRRNGGQPGQSIFANKIPNITNEILMMFDKARQLADESTGIPSYSHGQTGVAGIGRTASGMSMLMGAAAQNIKGVVRNIDDYFLAPFGRAMFAWNMQFDFDPDLLGDLEVKARGTESLMRNEVRSQKLLQLLQLVLNPMMAPFAKLDNILREIVASMDLDEALFVNDTREAGIQAQILADMQKMLGVSAPANPEAAPGASPAAGSNPTAAPKLSDPTGTGGGNIAPGNAPTPGAAGFTGQAAA